MFQDLISTSTIKYTYSYHGHVRDSGKAEFNEVFIISVPMIEVMLLLMLLTWIVLTWLSTIDSFIKLHICMYFTYFCV